MKLFETKERRKFKAGRLKHLTLWKSVTTDLNILSLVAGGRKNGRCA
jgi:hypothetical protein